MQAASPRAQREKQLLTRPTPSWMPICRSPAVSVGQFGPGVVVGGCRGRVMRGRGGVEVEAVESERDRGEQIDLGVRRFVPYLKQAVIEVGVDGLALALSST